MVLDLRGKPFIKYNYYSTVVNQRKSNRKIFQLLSRALGLWYDERANQNDGGLGLKTIGLIGGMSWESTVPYYRIINEEVKHRLGGLHSAKIVLYSVEFDEIERCQSRRHPWPHRNRDADPAIRLLAACF